MWAQALVSVYYYHHLTQWTSKKAHHFTIEREWGCDGILYSDKNFLFLTQTFKWLSFKCNQSYITSKIIHPC